MIYIRNTTDFYIEENTVISLGKFDGIHRGHELLLEHLAAQKERGLAGVIFTFDIPPRQNVEHTVSKVLTTSREKRDMFEQLGIDSSDLGLESYKDYMHFGDNVVMGDGFEPVGQIEVNHSFG